MSDFENLDVAVGDKCLVTVADQRFMVSILAIQEDSIHVSFPGIDYPVAGMRIDAEFHGDDSFATYSLRVVRGPETEGDGIVFERPTEKRQMKHRGSVRVETNMPVQIRRLSEVKYSPARAVNLSTGGALLESAQVFALRDTLDLKLELLDGETHTVQTEVLHIGRSEEAGDEPVFLYGTRFVGHEPGAGRAITKFIWNRLKELYPPD